MLKHALALVFLVLAVSPFTAPFQTFTAPQPLAVVTHDNGSASVVAPLITKTGRLTIAPPTGLVISRAPCGRSRLQIMRWRPDTSRDRLAPMSRATTVINPEAR